jgi:hypothetical protein
MQGPARWVRAAVVDKALHARPAGLLKRYVIDFAASVKGFAVKPI